MLVVRHPAKYSDALLPVFKRMLDGRELVLDPFAGTGKLRQVRPDAFLLEIEPEWAAINNAIVGDATNMPDEWTGFFDAICTSPTYGNRMADHFKDHQPHKKYQRNTYRHTLGRPLSENNSGRMQWGDKYRDFHERAWAECWRVLKPTGLFVLNISDHIRAGERQPVTDWHIETLEKLGFVVLEHVKVETPRQRYGQNGAARVEYESVIRFEKGML